jgi:hypothetical protein
MANEPQQPKSKKRTVYAPLAAPHGEDSPPPPAVISVELDEDEDIEWTWTHTSDGTSVVTGYTITKRTDKPGKTEKGVGRRVRILHSGGGGGAHVAPEGGSNLGEIAETSRLDP